VEALLIYETSHRHFVGRKKLIIVIAVVAVAIILAVVFAPLQNFGKDLTPPH